MEAGETLEEAARRELREELGLQVLSTGQIELTVVDFSSGYSICFVPVAVVGQPKLLEHTKLIWASRSELMNLNLAPSDRIFADYLSRGATDVECDERPNLLLD